MANARHIWDHGRRAGWKTPKQAFTRTDLTVVISISAIIATLVVLRLLNSRNSSLQNPPAQSVQSLQCLANLKQLAAAQFLYAVDNDQKFCPSYLDYHSENLSNVWMGALAEYHGRADGVWLCPAATNSPPRSYTGTADAPWTYTDRVSGSVTHGGYAINGYLGLGRNYKQAKAGTFKVRNVFHVNEAVRQPALTPVFCDAIYWNCRLEETTSPPRNLYQPQGIIIGPGTYRQILTQFIARHGDSPASEAPRELTSEFLPGAINMAFVDGHAETVPLENLWKLHWHKNWDPKKVAQPHPAPK
jgi:prepilin-type processing-associated H-X9-DG protein